MEDIDCYLRLCMRNYAAQQDLDEFCRKQQMKAGNLKPGQVSRLLAPFHWLVRALTRPQQRAH